MHNAEPLVLALEGPPGAGKTTLSTWLLRTLGDHCFFFPEPNPRLSRHRAAVQAGTRWFLEYERQRAESLRYLGKNDPGGLLLCDRNHLGALAYCYATRDPHAMPYTDARDYYIGEIAPHHAALTTVILQTRPRTSVDRRGGVPEHPQWRQWYDLGFLQRLHEFYDQHAPGLCPEPPLVIKTDGLTPLQIATELLRFLDLPDTAEGFPARSEAIRIDDRFARTYQAWGGLTSLGHPITPAFGHRGALIQVFELGVLHGHGERCEPWDPILHSRTQEAPCVNNTQ